ncbi:hypothetical protein [Desulfosediminicola flagellatus]|uniref:hypothetical protein n=1 Tax=Desulfosediminicola flagellatus TaxID=2569541 RepID=UPI0010AB7871|nr:hypothetical protein [Desulfosediminicola flagellatus]
MQRPQVLISCCLIVIIGLSIASKVYAESDEQLLAGVNSQNYRVRLDNLKIIERTTVEDSQIFQVLEDRLLKNQQSPSTHSKHIDEMAWTCKALASSADDRYLKTLQTVANSSQSPKLKKHCTSALNRYGYYKHRRGILSQPQIAGLSAEASKYIHLISSKNPEMMRSGIRMLMTSGMSDEVVFDKVRDVLLAQYNSSTDSKYIDSLAWLCKGLASSGNQKYAKDLKTVENNATSVKLQRYARESRSKLE